jgi:predicted nucleic acid-binding protein
LSVLVDAGPIVALIDADEEDHAACRAALSRLSGTLFTTWPAFSEAMYLLGRIGWKAQNGAWQMQQGGSLVIADLDATGTTKAAGLMKQYSNVPMDLADATLVALAEALEIRRIFTLDSDFHVYRYRDRQSFQVLP